MLTNDQKKKINVTGRKYALDFIVLYGSVAKKQEGSLSDIDIAIYRRGGISPKDFLEIYGKIGVIFLGKEVDLKTLSGVNPLFRYYVVRDGQLIYGNKTAYNFYKAFAYKDFQEAKPLFALEEYLVNKHQKELNRLYL